MDKRATRYSPSGKFKEKIALKQRESEKQMLENRLRVLEKQEERMQSQIDLANKNTALAYEAIERKKKDQNIREKRLHDIEL